MRVETLGYGAFLGMEHTLVLCNEYTQVVYVSIRLNRQISWKEMKIKTAERSCCLSICYSVTKSNT